MLNAALQQTLEYFAAEQRAQEARIRWPGTPAALVVPAVVVSVANYPTVTWQEVASLTLDPGRWLIVGQVRFTTADLNGYQNVTQMRIDGSASSSGSNAWLTNSDISSPLSIVAHKAKISTSVFTVTMDVSHSSSNTATPGARSCTAIDSTLIAYPL
jgi:hypothetical protein